MNEEKPARCWREHFCFSRMLDGFNSDTFILFSSIWNSEGLYISNYTRLSFHFQQTHWVMWVVRNMISRRCHLWIKSVPIAIAEPTKVIAANLEQLLLFVQHLSRASSPKRRLFTQQNEDNLHLNWRSAASAAEFIEIFEVASRYLKSRGVEDSIVPFFSVYFKKTSPIEFFLGGASPK